MVYTKNRESVGTNSTAYNVNSSKIPKDTTSAVRNLSLTSNPFNFRMRRKERHAARKKTPFIDPPARHDDARSIAPEARLSVRRKPSATRRAFPFGLLFFASSLYHSMVKDATLPGFGENGSRKLRVAAAMSVPKRRERKKCEQTILNFRAVGGDGRLSSAPGSSPPPLPSRRACRCRCAIFCTMNFTLHCTKLRCSLELLRCPGISKWSS